MGRVKIDEILTPGQTVYMQIDLLKLMEQVGLELLTWRNHIQPEVRYKRGKEIVSDLDIRAEQLIRQGVQKVYPHIPIWGEELGRTKETAEYILIDPIDGSKNYLAGLPEFASQIAYVKDNDVLWSIINLPALGQLYWAEKNQGAWCNNQKIQPSTQSNIHLALQCFGIGHEASDYISLAQLLGPALAEPRHFGSAGVHYAYLASGKIDIYLAKEAAMYDFAPGYLLCQETGVASCNLQGETVDFSSFTQGIVLANSGLIEQYKTLIRTQD